METPFSTKPAAAPTQKVTKDAFHRVQQRYDALSRAVAQIVTVFDPRGGIFTEERDWEMFTGQALSDYQGFGWVKALHPEDVDRTLGLWALATLGLQPFSYNLRIRRKDGALRWFSVSVTPIFKEDGTVDEWVGIHADTTDRKIADEHTIEALRELNDLKAAIDEHAIVAITDARGKITYVNEKFCAISKYSREELI